MNLFDVGVALAAVTATVSGWRRGVVEPVGRWLGMVAGTVIGVRHSEPMLAALARLGIDRTGTTVVGALVAAVIAGGLAGSALARAILHVAPVPLLRSVDRAAGSAIGAAGVVFVVWLVAPVAALVPGVPRTVSDAASTVLAQERLPPPPDLFEPVRSVAATFRADAEPRRRARPPADAGDVSPSR